ncbi:MAG: response regulator [Candidatus Promineifilaceae bacterium]
MSETILVIDDHFETLRLTSLILKRKSYKVLTAQSGAGGLEIARQKRPDLVLLDIMMPEMDGIEVCRQMRSQPGLDSVPIMMFTARSHDADREEALQAGASDYIVKPTRPKELLERVQDVLSKTQMLTMEPTMSSGQHIAVGLLAARAGLDTHSVATRFAHVLANTDRSTTLVEPLGRPVTRPKIALNGFSKQPDFDAAAVEAGELVVVDLGHTVSPAMRDVLPHLSHLIVCFSADLMVILDAEEKLRSLADELPASVRLHGLMIEESAEAATISRDKVEALVHQPILDIIHADHALDQYQQVVAKLLNC